MGNFIDLSRNIEYNEVFDEDFTKLPPNTRLFKVTFPEAMVLEYRSAILFQVSFKNFVSIFLLQNQSKLQT